MAELTDSHLRSKLFLLVDSEQSDEREGALDAVKFASHVVEAFMIRNHGQKSWVGVVEDGAGKAVGALAGSGNFAVVSGYLWGIGGHRTLTARFRLVNVSRFGTLLAPKPGSKTSVNTYPRR